MLLTVAHQISCSFRHLVRAKERAVRCRLAITASWVTLKNYLDAFKSRLNPQLFHQFPGLGDVISSGHTDPSDCANTEENWQTPRDGTKNDCRDVAPPRAHYPVVQQCKWWVNAAKSYFSRTKEQWTFVIPFQACGFFFTWVIAGDSTLMQGEDGQTVSQGVRAGGQASLHWLFPVKQDNRWHGCREKVVLRHFNSPQQLHL